jgi:hypothetical protein
MAIRSRLCGHCQHPRLPDRQPDPRPVLDGLGEYVPRLVEIVAGIEHAVNLGTVFGPFLDFVVVGVVREQRVVGFIVGPAVHFFKRRRRPLADRPLCCFAEVAGASGNGATAEKGALRGGDNAV